MGTLKKIGKKIAVTVLAVLIVAGTSLTLSGCKTTDADNPNPVQSEGGGGGPGCFTPETQILLADGTTKAIKEIVIGDTVKSFDFQKEEMTENKVIALFKFQKTEHLIINGLEVTKTHPFCIGRGQWTEAGMLKVGDTILGDSSSLMPKAIQQENLEKIKIETIEKVQKDVTVHNFTVDGTHNYFVSNGDKSFLVHNKGGGGAS